MKKISKSSDLEALKIKKILENNGIEVFVSNEYLSKTNPYTTSASGNQYTILKVKEVDYEKSNKLLKKLYINKNLFNDELIKQFEQIKHIHILISNRKTGSLKIFAKKIGLSQRQIFIKLKFLKNLNAKIKYNTKTETFFYKQPFELIFQFSLLSISNENTFELYCSSEDEADVITKKKSEYV